LTYLCDVSGIVHERGGRAYCGGSESISYDENKADAHSLDTASSRKSLHCRRCSLVSITTVVNSCSGGAASVTMLMVSVTTSRQPPMILAIIDNTSSSADLECTAVSVTGRLVHLPSVGPDFSCVRGGVPTVQKGPCPTNPIATGDATPCMHISFIRRSTSGPVVPVSSAWIRLLFSKKDAQSVIFSASTLPVGNSEELLDESGCCMWEFSLVASAYELWFTEPPSIHAGNF